MSSIPQRKKRKIGIQLTVGQIADLVGVDRKTVRKWVDTGALPGMRLPGDETQQRERRVHQDVLRQFLEAHGYTRIIRELNARTPPPKPPEKNGAKEKKAP
jgi:excisionase family DNA binding protein